MHPQVYGGCLPDPGQVLGPAAVGARVGLAHVSQEQAAFLGGGDDEVNGDDNDDEEGRKSIMLLMMIITMIHDSIHIMFSLLNIEDMLNAKCTVSKNAETNFLESTQNFNI